MLVYNKYSIFKLDKYVRIRGNTDNTVICISAVLGRYFRTAFFRYLKRDVYKRQVIVSAASVVGKHEYEGPLGQFFDMHDPDGSFGQKTWEQAEAEMQRQAINIALSKAKNDAKNIDALFSGDLINQCICSAQGTLSYDIPFFGLYGACSTIAEGLILSSLLISSGIYESTIAAASSHNSTAERQYRFPLEYGGQRTPTAQWTVTGAGAYVLMSDGNGPHIAGVMPGRTVERGIDDANNMGAAMAPAVIDTLTRYFTQTGTSPADYDLIACLLYTSRCV